MTLKHIILAAVFMPTVALADAPDFNAITDRAEKGLAIAEETDRRNKGFGDTVAEMKMVLIDARDNETVRELKQKSLENPDPNDGDLSMIIFDKPRDVKGTKLLTHAHNLEPDDQWMFLPAVKRVKRISSRNKSGPFLGSEFAFEDFSATEVGKYSYTWLRDEPCPENEGLTCHVAERIPLYEGSGYTRQITWTDTTDYQPRRVDYYDRKNSLLKTLYFRNYSLYLDQFWRAHELFMINHQKDKKTRLTWENFEFQTGLDRDDFTKASLKRAR